MSYYSRKIEMPKTAREGLSNFVQIIVNRIEAGDTREALLTAVDLLDTISGNGYADAISSMTDTSAPVVELKKQHAAEIEALHAKYAADVARAINDGIAEGQRRERARIAATLGLAA